MSFARRLGGALTATLTLAFFQVILQVLLMAVGRRNAVVPPWRFFESAGLDAFTKLYSASAGLFGTVSRLDAFVGPGFGTKLSLFAPLAFMNVVVGVGLAVLLAGLSARGRASSGGARPYLVAAVLVSILIHAIFLVIGGLAIEEPSVGRALLHVARSFVFAGTATALLVLAAATAASVLCLRRLGEGRVLGAAAVLLIAGAAWSTAAERLAVEDATPTPGAAEPSAVAEDYNVILISIDSLRADHVGSYGYPRATSPTMDDWASRGVRFENASSTTSWTLPSHMSMLTGRSLLGHGVVTDHRRLPEGVATLPEILQGRGFYTGAIVSAPYVNSRYGFATGFDEYDDTTIHYETFEDSVRKVTAPDLQNAARLWLEANASRRFFLFLHYWDAHYDYNPPPPYDSMFDPDYAGSMSGRDFLTNPDVHAAMPAADLDHILALYDGEIRLVDDHLEALRATLVELGIEERTIVVVTSDHGDEFFEHGGKGHHRTLYDEVMRVPLIIYVPGVEPATPVVQMESSVVDIFPTVLSLLGIPIPDGLEGDGLEGDDLSWVAYGDQPEWNRSTLGELYMPTGLTMRAALRSEIGMIIQRFRQRSTEVRPPPSAGGSGTSPLPHSELAATLATELTDQLNEGWIVFGARMSAGEEIPILTDEETREQLRALGYIQ